MAIIDEDVGFRACIAINGVPCPEYPAERDPELDVFPPSVRAHYCYVECSEDTEFSIDVEALPHGAASRWASAHDHHVLSPQCSFDGGTAVSALLLGAPALQVQMQGEPGWGPDHDQMRLFRFAATGTGPPAATAGASAPYRLPDDRRLGHIQVAVYRGVQRVGGEGLVAVPAPRSAGLRADKSNERKALSLNVT